MSPKILNVRSKYEHQEYLKPSLRMTSAKGSNSSSSQQPVKSYFPVKLYELGHCSQSFDIMVFNKRQHLEGMVEFIGLLKVTLKKGINLAVRDMKTSDSYVLLTLGQQVK